MTSIDNWFHRQMGKSGERAPMNGPVGDPGDQRDSWGRFGRQPENAIHKIETNTSIHRRALRTAAGGDWCRTRSTFLFKSAGTSNRRRVVPLLRARQSRDAVSDVVRMSPFLQTHNGSHPESGNWRRRSGGFRPTGRAWCAARRPASGASARTVNPGQISPALRRPDRSDFVTRFEQTLDRVWDRERSLWSESVSSPVWKQTQSCLLKRTGDPHAGPSHAGES